MPGHRYALEVQPLIPARLERLPELASNLLYSWDRKIRGLFYQIDGDLWARCDHNPKVFLRRVSQKRLESLARNRNFVQDYEDVMRQFDGYLEATSPGNVGSVEGIDTREDLIAYFCMEFGLHESLHLYSGGLGILAGDHCKAASNLGLPFVAIGLMYRQGYFTQTIDRHGNQEPHFHAISLADMPITPATDPAGNQLRINVPLRGRQVAAQVWCAQIGHVRLLLLDTEVPENAPSDRSITYQLYGGDPALRLAQELVLGIGGVRALDALGLRPTVWHLNEGHPALLLLERCRQHVAGGATFEAALEMVAGSTLFTTHTPVSAGHDVFSAELMTPELEGFAEDLGVSVERLMALGASPGNRLGFNMTALALRGTRHHNGVSQIHGRVAARMESYIWPDVEPEENPIGHVTNGVHVPTFLAREWVNLLDSRHAGWRGQLRDVQYWEETVAAIPDHRFWSLRQSLKSEMLETVRGILQRQYRRNGFSRSRCESMAQSLSPQRTRPLIIGFARRFATYKRALLIFQDLQRLARLVSDPERPLILLFAGKAHPQDAPGQALIRRINEHAAQPPFLDRVYFIEGYDMDLARKLVTGVDVWLNTPEHPMEASGTSGQKAAINGVLNLSVLDGWWDEGYTGDNGWAVAPHGGDLSPEQRDRIEAEDLLDLIELEIIPKYFAVGPAGYSEEWVQMAKRSMSTVLPRFNAERMLVDYIRQHYFPCAQRGRRMTADDNAAAGSLAEWKQRVRAQWPRATLEWVKSPPSTTHTGEPVQLEVAAHLAGLAPEDVVVECIVATEAADGSAGDSFTNRFAVERTEGDVTRFSLDLRPPDNGLFQLRIRMYPYHELLGHPLEMGRVVWL